MATIDKTKLQTYNFLLENKSIEDILNQPNITFKEIKNKRHGGKTFRIDNADNRQVNHDLSENNRENLEPVTSNLNKFLIKQEINNNIWIKFKNYLNWPTSNTKELIQVQKKYIEQLEQSNLEKDKEMEQLKKQNEEIKQLKQSNINFDKFKYNSITIYDEKQRKNTGIEKIHEEILSINNEIYFITTFVNINNSITEKVLYFDYYENNYDLQVINQTKKYQNINEYKNDFSLIEDTLINKNNCQYVPIKDFLKYQQDSKLKPNKSEKRIWWTITIISLSLIILTPILTFAVPALIPATATALLLETKIIIAVTSSGLGTIFKGFTSIFSPATKKVESWWYNKLCKNNEKKDNEKKERQSIIKNLTNDKLETKLQTQYEILKQELDNRKDKTINELLNNKTINNSSNIEPLNVSDFDSFIRNIVNQQESQPKTNTIYHSNSML